MRMNRLGMLLVGIALAGTPAAVAQGYYEDDVNAPRRRHGEPEPFLFTDRLVDLAIDRMTEEWGKHYEFDEEQLWLTRDVVKDKFPRWMNENRGELVSLTNQYMEFMLREDPPTIEEAALWAQRALPLFEEARGMIDDTADEMREFMTDDQQVMLDGELAAMGVGLDYMTNRLQVWEGGGYDWETEWPRSDRFREEERLRTQELNHEAERQKLIAMGYELDAEEGDESTQMEPGLVVEGGEQPGASGSQEKPKPKDEWEIYVDNFIKKFKLDDAQQNSARRILRSVQGRRDVYLGKRLPTINKLQEQLKTAETEDDRAAVKKRYDALNRPIEGYFEELKKRLSRIPTRRQRKLAMEAEAKVEVTVESERTDSPEVKE